MHATTVIHVMNTSYGKMDEYGARSRYIAEASGDKVLVFARESAVPPSEKEDRIQVIVNRIPVPYQALRYALAVLGLHSAKRRAVWRGFDRALLRKLKKLDLGNCSILHTWEYIPETIRMLKKRYPDMRIVRDIVVNRYREYWSGVPLPNEEPVTDLFVSPSPFSTECLLSWGIPKTKILEVPFGVDASLFKPRAVAIPDTPFRFCFSGGVSKRKGVDTLIDAWNELALPDAELHLYGRVRKDVERAVREAARVICHGHIYLPDELPNNHVFVFPSTLEGSAKSVYEALASGLPVITTPESGSIVRDGVDGMLVRCGDEVQLTEAMHRVYTDAALRKRMGESARRLAEGYTWARYSASILSAYHMLRAKGTENT